MSVRIDISIPTASGRRKGWAKLTTGINRAKRGGWAVLGEFLDEGQVDLELGDVVVVNSPAGSVKNGTQEVTVYVVEATGIEQRGDAYYCPRTELPSLLDTIEAALNEGAPEQAIDLSGVSDAQLLSELARRGLVS